MDTASKPDKDTEVFLAGVANSGAPAWEDLTIDQARDGLQGAMQACAAAAPSDAQSNDIVITGPGGDLVLRTYAPPGNRQTLLPVVLLFHGGGWCLGDLDCYESFARNLCTGTGFLIVSADYRLSPEHKFPAGLEDCHAALLWLQQNASEIGGDPNRIVLLGDSSGANFVAAVCRLTAQSGGQQPAAQILLCPFLDLRDNTPYPSRKALGGGDYYISEASIAWTIDHYLRDKSEAETVEASPILSGDFTDFPEALVVTAGFDPLRDEGKAYADKLALAGVTVDYHCFERTIHGFLTFDGVIAAGREGNSFVTDWLKTNL